MHPLCGRSAQHWVGELARNTAGRLVLVLVGNKADLVEARVVPEAAGRDFAARCWCIFQGI